MRASFPPLLSCLVSFLVSFLLSFLAFCFFVGAFFFHPSFVHAQETLEIVKSRGHIRCGVSQGLPGFSNPDDVGKWHGMDVDVCRAVSSAIFRSPNKVRYIPLSAKERFVALQSGEVDILSRNTTWTFHRDVSLGLEFAGVSYYDGQGFMVRKNLNVRSTQELSGASICVNAGTTTEVNVGDYFRKHNMRYDLITFEKTDEAVAAYDGERCDVYTTDQSGLYANRLKLARPEDHMILPEVISREPLGPVIRHGDQRWGDIVRWSLFALLNAEELGLSSQNVQNLYRSSRSPEVLRFLGREGSLGESLGLSKSWAYYIIFHVGNYAEMFERNLGQSTPLKIRRGINALWKDGGIQYAPPVR